MSRIHSMIILSLHLKSTKLQSFDFNADIKIVIFWFSRWYYLFTTCVCFLRHHVFCFLTNQRSEGLRAEGFDSLKLSPGLDFLSGTRTMAAAAACGPNSSVLTSPLGTREHSRKNREKSRRRHAALLFLNNISLDGRPVQNSSAQPGGSCDNKETQFDTNSSCSAAAEFCSEPQPTNSCGTLTGFSGSTSDGEVTPSPVPRIGLTIPPILVLPSEPDFNDAGSAEVLLGCRRGSVPSPGCSNLLSLSPSSTSLLPSPLGPRKSPTLLSVHSCSSVSSEPKPR